MWDPYKNRFRMLAACLMVFRNGMGDSAAGALIPYMERQALPPSPPFPFFRLQRARVSLESVLPC